MQVSRSLTEGSISRSLLTFAFPILVGNVLQSLDVTVNSIWIGRYLGEAALTASSNSNTVLFLLLAAMFGASMAATILIGQYLGARRLNDAKRVVGTSTSFSMAISAVMAALGWVISEPMLRVMQTPAAAMPLAVAYMRVIFLYLPFLVMYIFATAVLRGAGDSKTPLYFLILNVVLDIALNPLFIFGLGPVPRLGIAGSALATLVDRRDPHRQGRADGTADARGLPEHGAHDLAREPLRDRHDRRIRRRSAGLELRAAALVRDRHGGLLDGRSKHRRQEMGSCRRHGAHGRALSVRPHDFPRGPHRRSERAGPRPVSASRVGGAAHRRASQSHRRLELYLLRRLARDVRRRTCERGRGRAPHRAHVLAARRALSARARAHGPMAGRCDLVELSDLLARRSGARGRLLQIWRLAHGAHDGTRRSGSARCPECRTRADRRWLKPAQAVGGAAPRGSIQIALAY